MKKLIELGRASVETKGSVPSLNPTDGSLKAFEPECEVTEFRSQSGVIPNGYTCDLE